jgi:tRNA (Thr-GGU) A37 N-methylase
MSDFTVEPIGHVESSFAETEDGSGATLREHESVVVVAEAYAEALTNFDERVGTGEDALLDVIFYFDGVDEDDIELASESSRGLTPAGVGGVFTRRTFRRPNKLGLTTVRVLDRDGRRLRVEGLDALDGTPILDLKPHIEWETYLD